MSDEDDEMVEALRKAKAALQELTEEYKESIASHRRNGKILREMYEESKAAGKG